ncbi:hypothetical protein PG985_012209 [Apiospora marii]|uniref:uncharacterized protein n=1 Tax=Apiospora marii TaxID=335849 RepID=UPI003131DBA3
MSQYYGEQQWPGAGAGGQSDWNHQTPPPPPPPARSGASSTVPREELAAFSHQIEEVERAIDNLVKSGKMFSGPPMPMRHGRGSSGPSGSRHNSVGGEFGDARLGSGSSHSGGGLQNFYAAQRHQSSRGSNEAEQMMQAKRRLAAQRERELRNYHQEQQYNRTVLSDVSYPAKPERALSPGNMSEDERRELIARQRSALYGGEGSYSENGGYADEANGSRPGGPGLSTGPSSHRGPSPLAYEYARGGPDNHGQLQDLPGSRANSNASPQSNPASKGPFDAAVQQANRTSNSSPGGSPPRQGGPMGQGGSAVAPIGTRPSVSAQAQNPALNKRSTTPLPSPLSHGFNAAGHGDENGQGLPTSGAPSNPPSATPDGYNRWANGSGVWGKQSSGLGVQASVWG